MRNFSYILLAAVALLTSRGYSATDIKSVALAFYVVSDEKIDGGRFIDTLDLPKVGYVAAKPDLVITQLVAVTNTVSHEGMVKIGKDGKLVETPLPDRPVFQVQILPEDSQRFEALTKQSVGKRVLIMLGDTPLTAPLVTVPISTPSIQFPIGQHSDQKAIEDALKKLIR